MSQIGNQIAVPKRPNVAGRLLRIPNLVEARTTVSVQRPEPELDRNAETVGVALRDVSNPQALAADCSPLDDAKHTHPAQLATDGAAAVRVEDVGAVENPNKLGTKSPRPADRVDSPRTGWLAWIRACVRAPLARKIVKPAIFVAVLFAAYALATFFAGSTSQTTSSSEDAVIVEEITAVTSQPLRAAPRKSAKPRPVDEMFNVSPNLRVNVGSRETPSNSNRYQGVQATRQEEPSRAGSQTRAAQQPEHQQPEHQQPEHQQPERRATVAQRQPSPTPQARPNPQPPRTELARRRSSNPGPEAHQVARPLVNGARAEEGRSIYRYDSTDPATYREPDFDIPTVADRPGRRLQ